MTESRLPPQDLIWERLNSHHDRASFECGQDSLNVYLQRFARQNASRDVGLTYVAVFSGAPNRIAAYFTLSASQIQTALLPVKAPSPYPLPAFLLGRLAVDREFQNRGLGVAALLKAFRVVATIAEMGAVYALEVQALDPDAAEFYQRQNFTPLLDDALHLYIPISLIRSRVASSA